MSSRALDAPATDEAAAARPAAGAAPRSPRSTGRPLTPASLLALQRHAGNAAVSALIARRTGGAIVARCPCGGPAGPEGECEECRRGRTAGAALARSTGSLLQRQDEHPPAPAGGPDAVVAAVRAEDVAGAVAPLRGQGTEALRSLRATVNGQIDTPLERWLAQRRGYDEAAVDEGLRLLWRALPLVDRLLVLDEGWRELEQAQIDVIRAASEAERTAARGDGRLTDILARMEIMEEFEARKLIDPSPEGLYTAAERVLARAPGLLSDDEDAVFDAILALAPGRRRAFYDANLAALTSLLSESRLTLLRTMSYGTEAQAIVARLRQATEGRSDDMAAVQRVVDRAVELFRERQVLRGSLAGGALPERERAQVEARLAELADLDALLEFTRGAGGELDASTFMGMLSAARGDPGAFGADAARLGGRLLGDAARRHALQTAKERILTAGGDVAAIRAAIMELHAPREAPAAGTDAAGAEARQHEEDLRLRRELMADPAVVAAVGGLTGFERMLVEGAVTSDAFDETLSRLNDAHNAARWGDFFPIVLRIARNDDWRRRFRETSTDPFGVYARVHGDQRTIMERILETQKVPIDAILAFTGDVEVLRGALADVGEQERARLRLGASLAKHPIMGPPTVEQDEALTAYRTFEAQLRKSQTTLAIHFDEAGFHQVLWTVLGSEPTMEELSTGQGRFRAAELMYDEQQSQLRLGRGAAADFSETDETMAAAGREFAAQFEPLRQAGTLTMTEFAALSALHDRFKSRTREFAEASSAISEMAGVIAATVAGVVVVAATGGAATPAVVAAAAAAGGTARVVTREMFGEDYYDPAARDALLGAIDGALAVVGGALAQRGAAFVGLGGRALAGQAARAAGEVAEQATQRFTRRVAASAVESAIDGAFSGAVSEAFGKMTDPATWRRGVWHGLVRVGESALTAGLTGLASGGLIGAATPVVSAGGRRLLDAAAAQRIEATLAEAGARETLEAARAAAREGRAADVDRLLRELEAHLNPEEARILRRQLNDDLAGALGHPPGRASVTEDEKRLLAETAPLEGDALRPEQIEGETAIVGRSDPQPSTMEGYFDEVDLGNQHTWRRQLDETWCRFSKKSLCGTNVRGAKPVAPEVRERVSVAEHALAQTRERLAAARELAYRQWPAVRDKLLAHRLPGGRVDVGALSAEEREILEQVFPDREVFDDLTVHDVRRGSKGPAREVEALVEEEEKGIAALADASMPLYAKLRAARRTRVIDRVRSRAKGLDEISNAPPPSKELEIDHVYPLRRIIDLDGFRDLGWLDQVDIVNAEFNFIAMDAALNGSKGTHSWSSWPRRFEYPAAAVAEMVKKEEENLARLQALIAERKRSPRRSP
jgi:hypothetical protein